MNKMNKLLLILSINYCFSLYGQVGINNSAPNVTLEVTAKQTDGSTSEGIIAPRLTGDALHQAELSKKYGVLQDGTIAYVTVAPSAANTVGQTISIDAKGYYYYDSTQNKWLKFRCGSDSVAGIAGTVSTFASSSATVSGSLISGLPATGVTASIPYTGGNGGTYSAQTIPSTGVTGLTATLPAGTLMNGDGSVTYTISGTPSSASDSDAAVFAVSLGGQAGNLSVTVGAACGAYTAPGVWKNFMCQNLGADMAADPFTPSAAIHGAKYQWGYKPSNPLVSNSRYYTQTDDQTNPGTIAGWGSTAIPDESWLDAYKTEYDPCPEGYRVPTQAQWAGVISNNTVTRTGSWVSSFTNYTTALSLGSDLLLPAAGSRNLSDGTLTSRGLSGLYWSSTQDIAPNAYFLYFNSKSVLVDYLYRTNGFSIRCISE